MIFLFKNSQYAKKYLLRELKSNYHTYTEHVREDFMVIKTYGFTKDPRLDSLDSYILVMEYAPRGNLYKYLQNNFTEIDWRKKNFIINTTINGLRDIHNKEFIHRDLHSGNLLLSSYISKCSSIFSSNCSSINFSSNDYTSNELEFDIDIKSRLDSLGTKRNIEELNINSCESNGKRIKN
ncbi:unnamed protein product [Rhizophagus irregularis]|nr:unnamed protein product [Rhizophagus irregularis]